MCTYAGQIKVVWQLLLKLGNWAMWLSLENLSSRVSDQVGLKPACLATEASWSHEISGKEIIGVAKEIEVLYYLGYKQEDPVQKMQMDCQTL